MSAHMLQRPLMEYETGDLASLTSTGGSYHGKASHRQTTMRSGVTHTHTHAPHCMCVLRWGYLHPGSPPGNLSDCDPQHYSRRLPIIDAGTQTDKPAHSVSMFACALLTVMSHLALHPSNPQADKPHSSTLTPPWQRPPGLPTSCALRKQFEVHTPCGGILSDLSHRSYTTPKKWPQKKGKSVQPDVKTDHSLFCLPKFGNWLRQSISFRF